MKENYHAIGLMSGTSLDGLDVVEVIFNYSIENQWSFRILNAKTFSYENTLKQQLSNSKKISGQDLMLLSNQLGSFFGKAINTFIKEKNTIKSEIDFIAIKSISDLIVFFSLIKVLIAFPKKLPNWLLNNIKSCPDIFFELLNCCLSVFS